MPRYRRPNYRNYPNNEHGIHVAEVVEENGLVQSTQDNELEETIDSVLEQAEVEDITNQDMVNQDIPKQEISNLEMVNQEMPNLEISNLKMENLEMPNHEMPNQKMSSQEIVEEPILDERELELENRFLKPSISQENIKERREWEKESSGSSKAVNYAQVRVLNAASGYEPLFVIIGNRTVATDLAFGKLSPYERIVDGFKTVLVYSAAASRTPFLTTVIPFVAGTKITLAIIDTIRGLQLLQIQDSICEDKSSDRACIRFANLTFDDGPFDIALSDGSQVFSDINVKEVTAWKQAMPGDYDFYILETPIGAMPASEYDSVLNMQFAPQQEEGTYQFSFYQRILANTMYTACIIGGYYSSVPMQVIVIEN